MAVFGIIDIGVTGKPSRLVDKTVGHRTQPRHFVRRQHVGHDDRSNLVAFLDLSGGEYGVLLKQRLAGL
jgi:hypothetical protein